MNWLKQELIIDGVPIKLQLSFMNFETLLIEVTCMEDSWRNYISSGIRFLEIKGITPNGKEINGKFQIIDNIDDVFVLKSFRE